jgi:predicted  nucleic acid-binding Zn-ribbon protein
MDEQIKSLERQIEIEADRIQDDYYKLHQLGDAIKRLNEKISSDVTRLNQMRAQLQEYKK